MRCGRAGSIGVSSYVLSVRTPFRVSLIAAFGIFLEGLLVGLFHHDNFNGHTLTPSEELPLALALAVFFSVLGLLGTWLGTRHGKPQNINYRAGAAVALIYRLASFVANMSTSTAMRTVTVPSPEVDAMGREVLVIALLWGSGAPFVIGRLVSLLDFFGISKNA